MKLIESHDVIRITNDKGTKLITAIRNKDTECYYVSYTTKGSYKVLATCANKQVINEFAVRMLSK